MILFFYRQTKEGGTVQLRRLRDDDREEIADDVWHADLFKFRVFTFEEAVKCFREVFHPTIYNLPDAPISAYIELDMSTDKKVTEFDFCQCFYLLSCCFILYGTFQTKFFEGWANIVAVNHPFPQSDDRSILAFCKLHEQMDQVTEAGATLAGGIDIIKNIKVRIIFISKFYFVLGIINFYIYYREARSNCPIFNSLLLIRTL